MKLYKLTDQNGNAHGNTNWLPKTTHEKEPCGNPQLCSRDVLHAYTNSNLALLLNPIHADIPNPRLFECSGKIATQDWGKVGCFSLTSKKELELPEWYTSEKTRKNIQIQFAILCTLEVLHVFEDQYPKDDRPRKAIEAAQEYLKKMPDITNDRAAAYAAADAARAAAYAAADAARAARAAAYAAADAARAAAYAAADAAADAARAAAYAAADAARANTPDFDKLADLAIERIKNNETKR